MKRILSLLLCLLLLVGFVASCENEEFTSNSMSEDSSSTEPASEPLQEPTSEPSQEMSSAQTQEPVDDEEKVDNDKSFKHYTFESTVAVMPEIEVLTNYEELVEYSNGKGLHKADLRVENENNVEFDVRLFENTFEDNFVIAVPFNFTEYEELYYNGFEEYEDGTYALVLVLKHQYNESIEKTFYNFDFVIVPRKFYSENMENGGIKLYVEWLPVEPTYNIPENTPYNKKVTNATKEKLHSMSEGEYIPLTVWLYSPPHTAVQGNGISDYELSSRVNKFNALLSAYKSEHGEMETTEVPIDKLREFTGNTDENIMTDTELISCLESVGGVRYTIKIYEIYKDTHEYRQSIKNDNIARNEEFCALLDMTKCRNIYKNSLLCVITLECERDYVLALQEMSLVNSISWNNPSEDILEENEDCDA